MYEQCRRQPPADALQLHEKAERSALKNGVSVSVSVSKRVTFFSRLPENVFMGRQRCRRSKVFGAYTAPFRKPYHNGNVQSH